MLAVVLAAAGGCGSSKPPVHLEGGTEATGDKAISLTAISVAYSAPEGRASLLEACLRLGAIQDLEPLPDPREEIR